LAFFTSAFPLSWLHHPISKLKQTFQSIKYDFRRTIEALWIQLAHKFHLDFIKSLGHNAVIKAVPLSSSYGFRPGHLSVFRGIKVVFALFGLMSVGLTSGLKSVALK